LVLVRKRVEGRGAVRYGASDGDDERVFFGIGAVRRVMGVAGWR
jgi:hypothetical protein